MQNVIYILQLLHPTSTTDLSTNVRLRYPALYRDACDRHPRANHP